MANWSDLKAGVAEIIKTNGNQEITGNALKNVLNNIISNVGANATFVSIATLTTNPGTPDGVVFYLPSEIGTYSNFNGLSVDIGEIAVFIYRTSWRKYSLKYEISEVFVSKIFPTGGIDGTNKYTLETAIAKIPKSLRSVGIKCSFLDEAGTVEEWVYQGRTFTNTENWEQIGATRFSELEDIVYNNGGYYLNGVHYNDDNWLCTDYIYIKDCTQIEVIGNSTSTATSVNLFDVDKKFISAVDFGIITNLPINAVYAVASSRKNGKYHFRVSHVPNFILSKIVPSLQGSITETKNGLTELDGNVTEVKQTANETSNLLQSISSDVLVSEWKDTNLYNPDDLLLGWYIKNNEEFIEHRNGIMSGKIILENGVKYASQGVQIGTGVTYLHGANFDSEDNYLGRFLWKGDVKDTDKFIGTFTAPANYAYSRIMFQSSNPGQTIVPFSKDYSMLEKSDKINPFIPYGGRETYTIKEEALPVAPEPEKRYMYMEGASFVDWDRIQNGWFELACEKLGVLPLNKAVSGSSILDFANKIYEGTAWTEGEFESFDILAIMHVHNYDVADEEAISQSYTLPFDTVDKTPANYAQAYDYVLSEYAKQCYACKDKESSRWYGQKMGKPFRVICCTHWHDARTTFNAAIRNLQKKWGFELCEFDKHIGFTKDKPNPATNEQWSILYCDNGIADTEVINGVTYGWHQTRGKDAYIQQMMAQIFCTYVKKILI